MDQSDLLETLLSVLKAQEIRFCVIGGQATNAYVELLISLDLDRAVTVDTVEKLKSLFAQHVEVKRRPHGSNISYPVRI